MREERPAGLARNLLSNFLGLHLLMQGGVREGDGDHSDDEPPSIV